MPGSLNPIGVIALSLLCLQPLCSQQSINASGGDAPGSGGSMAWSIGQIAYTAANGSSGMISQGVQQTYLEIMVSNGEPLADFDLRLFPNPSSSFTFIAIEDIDALADLASFTYQLFDVYGHFLWSATMPYSLNYIPTADLVSGMYILKVFYKTQPIKTFRFIKTE